ncbi:MAG: ComEC/Rec2 family competence protein [Bacteroidota bacterium]
MLPTLTTRHVPLLRVAMSMIVGIVIGDQLYLTASTTIAGVAILGAAALCFDRLAISYYVKSIAVYLLWTGVGIGLITLNLRHQEKMVDEFAQSDVETFVAQIVDLKSSIDRTTLFTRAEPTKAGIVIYLRDSDHRFERGELIAVHNRPERIKSQPTPTGFDYASYLDRSGFHFRLYASSDQIKPIRESSSAPWTVIRYTLRNWCLKQLQIYVPDRSVSILQALLLGDRSGLTPETKDSFADSGIIHILAVSGLHVGIIAYVLFEFYRRVFWWLDEYHLMVVALLIGSLVCFAELSGGAPSVWRAVIMASVYLISRTTNRRAHGMNLLGCSAILILVTNPVQLFTASFQLSFAAVGAIILLAPWIDQLWKPEHWTFRKMWGLLNIGLCAQLGTLPFALYYFHQIPLLSPLLSLIVVPIAGVLIILGVLILLVANLSSETADWIGSVADIFIQILGSVASASSRLPFSRLTDIWITWMESVLIFGIIALIATWLYQARRTALRLAFGLTAFLLFGHVLRRELEFHEKHVIHYGSDAIDIIHRGEVYHYNSGTRPVSDYLLTDSRSKYQGKKVIELSPDQVITE